ncbi:MAG: hypothetical protein U0353_10345 [Sandaracinus sp.]
MRLQLGSLVAVLAVLAVVVPTAGRAQDDAVARLRARVAESPGDVSLQCQLSFALVGAAAHEEARSLATAAIDAIPRPLTRTTRRTAGACLYNLGRAEEGLGHRREAVRAYARSLVVRDNEAVRERLAAMVPQVESAEPMAAYATTLLEDRESCEPHVVGSALRVGPDVFHFVPMTAGERGYTSAVLVVLVVRDDRVVAERVDAWSHEEQGAGSSVQSVRAWRAAGLEGAVAAVSAGGGMACGGDLGFVGVEHETTVLASFDGTRLRTRVLVTSESGCRERTRMQLRVQGGDVIVTRSRRGSLEPGTYPIPSLLR